MSSRITSWAVITTRAKTEEKLLHAINTQRLFMRNNFDNNKSIAENIMQSLGYRLEYSVPQANNTVRHIYVWDEGNSNFMYPIKEAYSMIGSLYKANCDIVGMAEDHGTLYWVYALQATKIEIKTLFFSNIENGFHRPEDMPLLQSTLDYINIKERSMLALGGSSFTHWFQRVEKVIETVQNADINN